jgi:hypothetical protein
VQGKGRAREKQKRLPLEFIKRQPTLKVRLFLLYSCCFPNS